MTVAVLQAGSWGTTLATILARDGGKDVVLWVRDPAQAKEIAARRENRKYLAGIRVPDRVEVTADLERALASDDLIVAAPSAMMFFNAPQSSTPTTSAFVYTRNIGVPTTA